MLIGKSLRWHGRHLLIPLAWLAIGVAPVHAQLKKFDVIDLATVLQKTDEYIAGRRRPRTLREQLNNIDATRGWSREVEWDPGDDLFPHPFSFVLRSLVFHAVCRENRSAMAKLIALELPQYTSFFSDLQGMYLNDLARRLSLDAKFPGQTYRGSLSNDPGALRRLNDWQDMRTALKESKHRDALRVVLSFWMLCRRGTLK
ncbi:MAG: hypothetical protein AAF732_17575 [Pseudomonadota bacterium]